MGGDGYPRGRAWCVHKSKRDTGQVEEACEASIDPSLMQSVPGALAPAQGIHCRGYSLASLNLRLSVLRVRSAQTARRTSLVAGGWFRVHGPAHEGPGRAGGGMQRKGAHAADRHRKCVLYPLTRLAWEVKRYLTLPDELWSCPSTMSVASAQDLHVAEHATAPGYWSLPGQEGSMVDEQQRRGWL